METHNLAPDLKDLEQIRQAILGNIKQVSFTMKNGTKLNFMSEERLRGKLHESKGKVSWLNQEH